jgi:hypothetical protein
LFTSKARLKTVQCPVMVKKKKKSWGLVGHTCNSSYSGGKDKEDFSLKPAQIVFKALSKKYPT